MVCGTPDPKNYKKLYNNVGTLYYINPTPIQFTGWGSLSVEISVIMYSIR